MGGGVAPRCGTVTVWGGLEWEGAPHAAGTVQRRQRADGQLRLYSHFDFVLVRLPCQGAYL